jgi:hypothetical protein
MSLPLGDVTSKPVQTSDEWPWGQFALCHLLILMCLSVVQPLLSSSSLGADEAWDTLLGIFALPLLVLAPYAIWRSIRLRQLHQRPRRVAWLRWTNQTLAAVILLSVFAAISIPAFHSARIAANKGSLERAVKEASIGEWTCIATSNGVFSIEAPAHWIELETVGHPARTITRVDPSQAFGVMVLTEPKSDFSFSKLDDYSQEVLKQLESGFKEMAVLETTRSTLPGKPAIQMRLAATGDGVKLSMLLWFQETPQHFIQLRAFSLPSLFDDNEATLQRSLSSYREPGA